MKEIIVIAAVFCITFKLFRPAIERAHERRMHKKEIIKKDTVKWLKKKKTT